MESENPSSADNQQETKVMRQRLDSSWMVGYADTTYVSSSLQAYGVHHETRESRHHAHRSGRLSQRLVVHEWLRFQPINGLRTDLSGGSSCRNGSSESFCRDPQRLYARPLVRMRGDDTVRSSWRHGESGRNDLTVFRAAVPHIDIRNA